MARFTKAIWSRTTWKKLEKAQNRAVNLFTAVQRRTLRAKLLQELGWSRLGKRHKSYSIIILHRSKVDEQMRHYIKYLLPNSRLADIPRDRRSMLNHCLSYPAFNAYSFLNSSVPRGIGAWNGVPIQVRKINNISLPKKRIIKIRAPENPNPYFSLSTKHGHTSHKDQARIITTGCSQTCPWHTYICIPLCMSLCMYMPMGSKGGTSFQTIKHFRIWSTKMIFRFVINTKNLGQDHFSATWYWQLVRYEMIRWTAVLWYLDVGGRLHKIYI